MSEQAFDPSQYLTKVGKADYLQVMWRIVWFRDRHPDGAITSELIDHDKAERWAMFRATVSIPGGGSATDYGSESARDFPDYIEKASTKAIGRALAALGFGTQFSAWEFGGEAAADRIVDSPVDFASTRGRRMPSAPENAPEAPGRARGTTTNTVPQNNKTVIQNPTAPASDSQVNYIRGLAKQAGMVIIGPEGDEHVNERELSEWIGGTYQHDWPQINKGQASEIIEGLKEEARKAAAQR